MQFKALKKQLELARLQFGNYRIAVLTSGGLFADLIVAELDEVGDTLVCAFASGSEEAWAIISVVDIHLVQIEPAPNTGAVLKTTPGIN